MFLAQQKSKPIARHVLKLSEATIVASLRSRVGVLPRRAICLVGNVPNSSFQGHLGLRLPHSSVGQKFKFALTSICGPLCSAPSPRCSSLRLVWLMSWGGVACFWSFHFNVSHSESALPSSLLYSKRIWPLPAASRVHRPFFQSLILTRLACLSHFYFRVTDRDVQIVLPTPLFLVSAFANSSITLGPYNQIVVCAGPIRVTRIRSECFPKALVWLIRPTNPELQHSESANICVLSLVPCLAP